MSQYRAKIKTCLQMITKSIQKLPEDKQPLIASRVNKVLQKYSNQDNTENLQNFQKQLQFNLNFIKLSYPNINFISEQKPQHSKNTEQGQKQNINEQNIQNQYKNQIVEGQFQILNSYELKKQMKDISSVREEVSFTNWSEGNVDPENLKRHKQLLTRQHFGGDYWKGKELPKMQTAQILTGLMENNLIKPPKIDEKSFAKKQYKFPSDPQKMFEKVKR